MEEPRRPVRFTIAFKDVSTSELHRFITQVVDFAKIAGATKCQVDELPPEPEQSPYAT